MGRLLDRRGPRWRGDDRRRRRQPPQLAFVGIGVGRQHVEGPIAVSILQRVRVEIADKQRKRRRHIVSDCAVSNGSGGDGESALGGYGRYDPRNRIKERDAHDQHSSEHLQATHVSLDSRWDMRCQIVAPFRTLIALTIPAVQRTVGRRLPPIGVRWLDVRRWKLALVMGDDAGAPVTRRREAAAQRASATPHTSPPSAPAPPARRPVRFRECRRS